MYVSLPCNDPLAKVDNASALEEKNICFFKFNLFTILQVKKVNGSTIIIIKN